MNLSTLQIIVDEAIAIDRQVSKLNERLKGLKADLVSEGRKHTAELTSTEGGGTVRQDVPAGDRERSVLSDAEALTLGRWAQAIESHYGAPMDISGRRTA